MPEKVMPGPVEDSRGVREAVCIHTRKIMDSARDKDCVEGLRFYPQLPYAEIISRAMSVKGGEARLLHTYVDVEPVNFNRGFYTVDMRFFYEVTLQVYLGCPAPAEVKGLCVFDKRAILFGGDGNAKIFSSRMAVGEMDPQLMRRSNAPIGVVEAVDPLVLDAKVVDCCARRDCDCELCEVPSFVNSCFDGELSCGDDSRRIYVTLGQFSMVRLERDTQLLIPAYDYCIPDKACNCGCGCEDPCSTFKNVKFPVEEFFPSDSGKRNDDHCGCGC